MSSVASLDQSSLSPSTRSLLQRAGFQFAHEIINTKPTQLAQELGLSVQQALAIINEVKAANTAAIGGGGGTVPSISTDVAQSPSVGSIPVKPKVELHSALKQETSAIGENALDLMRRRASLRPIPTYCTDLDAMMGGGVPMSQLTEFCGVPGAGKTQLCMQLACNLQTSKRMNGYEGETVYIDSEGSFLAERALSIAEGAVATLRSRAESQSRSLPENKRSPIIASVPQAMEMMKKIHVFRVFDFVEQLATIKAMPSFIASHPDVKLIVIDSVAFHFRRGFNNDMAQRARLLTGLAQELLYLANKYQLAVVVTNQVTTRLDSTPFASTSAQLHAALSPALGESWAHSCTNRIMLDFEGTQRVARLLKSPSMKSQTIQYEVVKEGLRTAAQIRASPTIINARSTSPQVTAAAQANLPEKRKFQM